MEALVVGGGVVGLSTALRLQEAGWGVRVWTADPPERTTSAVAAALWYPYCVGPEDRVAEWGERTLRVFEELARDPATGVRMTEGIEVWPEPAPDPPWRHSVPSFRRAAPGELPPGYADGYLFTVPVAAMPVYLAWLVERFLAAGGRIERRAIRSLDEAGAEAPLVAHCTGMGARALAGDPLVVPVRGQVVRVRNPGLERFWLDELHPEGVTYVIPRGEDCILGGTAEEGAWDLTPDPAVAASILRRCASLEPRLAGAEVLEHRVGLRPGRPAVRLEAERLPGGALCIHNYGHGGAGMTLSWGCAEAVVSLAGTLGNPP